MRRNSRGSRVRRRVFRGWGHLDATAILLAYRHGLRASELVALRWDDVDFTTGKLHVRRAKGGMTSVQPLGGKELRA
jgi:integrase